VQKVLAETRRVCSSFGMQQQEPQKLTPELKEKLKTLNELQVYSREAKAQIADLQKEIGNAMFSQHEKGEITLQFGNLKVNCNRRESVAIDADLLNDATPEQVAWLCGQGVLTPTHKFNKREYNKLSPEIKGHVEKFLTSKISAAAISIAVEQ